MASVKQPLISGGIIMNIWENAVLTDKGTSLQAKLVDGQTLHITKVVSGGAKVPVVNLRQQTNVTDGGKEITLQPVRIEGDKTVLPVLLENTDLEEGYDLWQVGIYAQDPEEGEILYCLAQASEAKQIPSAKEGPGFSVTWDFVIKTSNTAPFEVDVNSVGLVSIEQYQVHAGEIHRLKNSIVNLDERIEGLNSVFANKFECGNVAIAGKSGEWVFVTINYSYPHENVPLVIASHGSAEVAQCACTTRYRTTTGFQIGIYNTTAQTTFNWLAIEP